jgi:hypothetical protein
LACVQGAVKKLRQNESDKSTKKEKREPLRIIVSVIAQGLHQHDEECESTAS